MPNLGPVELGLIVLILLLVVGPGKLAGLGSSLGKSIREFRKATQEPEEEVRVEREARPAEAKATAAEERREIRRPTVSLAEEPKPAAREDESGPS